VQNFESSVNKVFQKEKLVNSKTIKYTEVCSGGANLVHLLLSFMTNINQNVNVGKSVHLVIFSSKFVFQASTSFAFTRTAQSGSPERSS